MTPTPTQLPAGLATLTGGVDLEITLADGSKENVRVHQLKLRDFPKLLTVLDDEAGMVEVYCGKEKGWADTLPMEFQVELLAQGEALNADFFTAWLQRRMARQEKLMPGSVARLQQVAESALNSGSPKSPSAAA